MVGKAWSTGQGLLRGWEWAVLQVRGASIKKIKTAHVPKNQGTTWKKLRVALKTM